MTRALHELVVDGSHERIDDPAQLNRLNEEFYNTVRELGTHAVDPEVIADVDHASERIRRGLGALGIREMYALMDAAALSDNPDVDKLAQAAIDVRFPIKDTGHTAYEEANRRSRLEWKEGLRIAKESEGKKPFGNALVEAGVATDKALDNDFDEVIDESNLAVREQRHKKGEAPELTPKEREDLDHYRENRRRRQERQKLAEIGELDDEDYDDAVKFDPFADDEDDEQAA